MMEILRLYAPFSWVMAAMIGALLFAAIAAAIAVARERWIRMAITKSYSRIPNSNQGTVT